LQIKTETRVGIFVIIALGIFFYMTLQLGVFRLHKGNYKLQVVKFNDIGGLERKAEVKIAGVTIGWVDHIELIDGTTYLAKAYIMILKQYMLHTDASARIRQEGLLGTKYLELLPGDPSLPVLPPGHELGSPAHGAVSIDDILRKVDTIAGHVVDVTESLHESFGTPEGRSELQHTLRYVSQAAEKIATFANSLDRTLSHNENNINNILADVREITHEMSKSVPELSDNFSRLSKRMEGEFLPSLQQSLERISIVFDRDVNRIAQKVEKTTDALEGAAQHAADGFRNISSIAGKLDDGKGLLGQLINDEDMSKNTKYALEGLKNYFSMIDKLSIVLDAHGEFMYRPAEHMVFEEAKGYIDVRIHPSDDHFYLIQRVTSQRGNLLRRSLIKNWYDENDRQFLPSDFFVAARPLGELVGRVETIERTLDTPRYGLQVGKIFKDVALRFGLIEGWSGIGIDVEIPFNNDNFRWVTTVELFDFRGRQRINDSRPHLKWINRVFVLRNIYCAFGADDFISIENSNGFFGVGLRFDDAALKAVAAKFGFLSSGGAD
jgi:phospholipid/cholesterol/gamma-HCH transport system substrate-binding protein